MSTIFTKGRLGSAVDMDTLIDEGKDQNHFVSLIVNNAGSYAAAITRKVDRTVTGKQTTSYNSFNNKMVNLGKSSDFTMKDFYIEYFMLDIEVEHPVIEKNPLEDRLKALRESASSFVNSSKGNYGWTTWGSKEETPKQLELFEKDKNPENNQSIKGNIKKENIKDSSFVSFPPKSIEALTEEDLTEEELEVDETVITCELVESHVAQLITGNLFASYNKNLDLQKWVSNMPNIYGKRFKDFSDFKIYAESMIDSLYSEVSMELQNSAFDVDYNIGCWSQLLIDSLEELGINEYLSYYTQILSGYQL